MNSLLAQTPLFGAFIVIAAYLLGLWLQKYIKISVLSPFLISVALVITFLVVCKIDYAAYERGANYLTFLLTPATVCLAIPLYKKFDLLKKDWKAVLCGIVSGVLTNAAAILSFSMLFKLTHTQYVTLLPKSVTTAISLGLSNELGGIITITIAATAITGITGNVLAPLLCRLFRIHEPVARGVAVGTASHAIGTARAVDMGETEGAMSGLSIAITGIITVIFASFFAMAL